MSNKIVPGIYRAVIDEVVAACKPEFEEYGVSEEVLNDLQKRWEAKVIASRVAEFDPPPQVVVPQYPPQPVPHYPPPAHHTASYIQPPPLPPPPIKAEHMIKSEPLDSRYALSAPPYTLPPLPGPKLNLPPPRQPPSSGQLNVLSFPTGPQSRLPSIPQVDGPSHSDDSDDESPPPPSFAPPRALHPSLPQPVASTSTSTVEDSEAINSDLDDSDEDDDLEDGAANVDILFCTYDKVARVKSKWKCVLKEGMVHANGKDYLFQRCTCEFNFEF
ncbi:Transcriptional factor IIA alpha/beta subunit [Mycena indigotica]|uniref:Transcriptional factor IIA alpha/beta subunit n=1 Tax=Mycena indigotica TaxID=2126181 RepID=A0A8H6TDI2_9AGAR|nr:Transcriptional factor IIA alpha/beta subunit [Mycena indigotica]KAF7315480.1 Transcriptional factor IIA alpha/beta subunit [Mycena indigotica]